MHGLAFADGGIRTEIHYLDDEFHISGAQLMSAKRVKMKCKYRRDGGPARFIVGSRAIPATVDHVICHDEAGLTSVGDSEIQVKHTEHVLSALYGMCVIDTDIYLDHEDGSGTPGVISPPAMQLNSREVCHAILTCFLTNRLVGPPTPGSLWPSSQFAIREPIILDRCYTFHEDDTYVRHGDPAVAVFTPLHKLHITAQINFPTFLGTQIYSQTITPLDYAKSICWARSFFGTPYPHNVEWNILRAKFPGLVRDRESHFRSVMLDYTDTEWITPAIVNTEPVRHKMLDVIGDLALLGRPINAGIHIYKPSHRFNRKCAMQLAQVLGLSASPLGTGDAPVC
jgi:UDP-3-O-acyl-N-acetylglucosamine deacetylase